MLPGHLRPFNSVELHLGEDELTAHHLPEVEAAAEADNSKQGEAVDSGAESVGATEEAVHAPKGAEGRGNELGDASNQNNPTKVADEKDAQADANPDLV